MPNFRLNWQFKVFGSIFLNKYAVYIFGTCCISLASQTTEKIFLPKIQKLWKYYLITDYIQKRDQKSENFSESKKKRAEKKGNSNTFTKSKKHIKNTGLYFHLRQQLPRHYFNVARNIFSVDLLYKTFPSDVHTIFNPCSNFAFFRISIRFGVKLYVILTLDSARFFLLEKNLFPNIVSTKFHYNWSRFILNSLLFPNFVRLIQIYRWNLNVHFCWYRFYHWIVRHFIISFNDPMNQETGSARILLILIYFFFEIYNFLFHYWYILFQVLDYLFSFFSFFLILVELCAYKVNCFIQTF